MQEHRLQRSDGMIDMCRTLEVVSKFNEPRALARAKPQLVILKPALGINLNNSPKPADRRRVRAFTLVELVIVMTIVGIMAAIAVPKFSSATEQARFAETKASAVRLQKAIDVYFAEHSKALMPMATFQAHLNLTSGDCGILIDPTDFDGDCNSAGLYGPYLAEMPINQLLDPANAQWHVAARQFQQSAIPVGIEFGWLLEDYDSGAPRVGFFQKTTLYYLVPDFLPTIPDKSMGGGGGIKHGGGGSHTGGGRG
ncbi:MAG: hypothetical protein HJJLKODD_00579 [Phycisphaerae bacterium]|nr:hypothetical protein [Phycisphaerae bacterium]